MKISAKLFFFLAVFYAPLIFIYGYFTHWKEPVGTVGFALSTGVGLMIALYLMVTERKTDESPSDREEGEINEIAGDYGFFSPHSWWPIALAAAISLFSLGVAVGWWLTMIAVPLICLAVVGWVFEYFRGENAV